MTHLSRPYQIALAAIALIAAVWFIALRGHSSSSSSSGSSSPPAQPAASSSASTTPYHGAAPGVAGLTRAIEKARGAVAVSEANAKQLARQSAQASSASSSAPASVSDAPAATSGSGQATTTVTAGAAHTATGVTVHARAHTATSPAAAGAAHVLPALSRQRAVEADLAHGKVVAILFWNPYAPVDQVVQGELRAAARALHGRLAVIDARAKQVGQFGTFTRAVQVYGTPTILIVTRHGETSSLTGLTDAYSLEQAIAEANQ